MRSVLSLRDLRSFTFPTDIYSFAADSLLTRRTIIINPFPSNAISVSLRFNSVARKTRFYAFDGMYLFEP